ncbi:unnamed protein product [Amoebophrya sp. A25]|nr:unnamed protein product [Amoebophrya sp. A25]|eukprot:GSA25T00027224001.1
MAFRLNFDTSTKYCPPVAHFFEAVSQAQELQEVVQELAQLYRKGDYTQALKKSGGKWLSSVISRFFDAVQVSARFLSNTHEWEQRISKDLRGTIPGAREPNRKGRNRKGSSGDHMEGPSTRLLSTVNEKEDEMNVVKSAALATDFKRDVEGRDTHGSSSSSSTAQGVLAHNRNIETTGRHQPVLSSSSAAITASMPTPYYNSAGVNNHEGIFPSTAAGSSAIDVPYVTTVAEESTRRPHQVYIPALLQADQDEKLGALLRPWSFSRQRFLYLATPTLGQGQGQTEKKESPAKAKWTGGAFSFQSTSVRPKAGATIHSHIDDHEPWEGTTEQPSFAADPSTEQPTVEQEEHPPRESHGSPFYFEVLHQSCFPRMNKLEHGEIFGTLADRWDSEHLLKPRFFFVRALEAVEKSRTERGRGNAVAGALPQFHILRALKKKLMNALLVVLKEKSCNFPTVKTEDAEQFDVDNVMQMGIELSRLWDYDEDNHNRDILKKIEETGGAKYFSQDERGALEYQRMVKFHLFPLGSALLEILATEKEYFRKSKIVENPLGYWGKWGGQGQKIFDDEGEVEWKGQGQKLVGEGESVPV